MKLHPWNFYKIVLHPLEFQLKNQDQDPSWKFHIIFSGSPFEIPLIFFLLAPGISTFYFFNNPAGTSMSSTSPVWMFSGIAHWKLQEKWNGSSYRWLSVTQNLRRDKAIVRIKHKIYSRQWEFELSNVNFWWFRPEEASEIIWFVEYLQQGFV